MTDLGKALLFAFTIFMFCAIAWVGGRDYEKQRAVDAGAARWTVNQKGQLQFEYQTGNH